ncbi:MAG TPA: hypothetical protein VNG33_16410 [Polyangiaceae bacterium]|nr:hypothetical protein [Polyangiaceae bacterium]
MRSSKMVTLACLGVVCAACSGTKVITVKQINLDGNSEYWVCDAAANTCAGEHAGDIDPAGYQARAEVHAPPKQCKSGVANIDIVLDGSDVKRVRYECAQPPVPSGTGPGVGLPPSTPSAGAGLPPSTPGAGAGLPPSTKGAAGGQP